MQHNQPVLLHSAIMWQAQHAHIGLAIAEQGLAAGAGEDESWDGFPVEKYLHHQ